jgi:EAL domain-containing protein (putative c-di-GMP-specific phosphodiesterase class I)
MLPDLQSLSEATPRLAGTIQQDVWFLSGAVRPGDTIRHIPIDQASMLVGRKPGAAISLQYRTVSGSHAQLDVADGELRLTDLKSTNGTFVNGKRLLAETVVLREEDLIHFAEAPFRVRRQSPASDLNGTIEESVCDQALALVQFDRLMNQRLVVPHFQPIVNLKDQISIGFEVLGRSRVLGLETVSAMFEAAERLNLEVDLSRLLRWEGIRVGREIPDHGRLFVNTHPKETSTPGLLCSLAKLRELAGSVPIVLEIHEAAVTNPSDMQELWSHLQALNIELAYDDFGSGQARLAELVAARPHYVKFDISLIRAIDRAEEHRVKLLDSLVQMVRDLDICALAEGVETEGEARVCRELGFDLAQGFYFGHPVPATHQNWS